MAQPFPSRPERIPTIPRYCSGIAHHCSLCVAPWRGVPALSRSRYLQPSQGGFVNKNAGVAANSVDADGAEDGPDVLIVGSGPVGLTLANILGARGLRVLVVEERAELIDYPRGVGLDDESLRTFQSIGLADRVQRHTIPYQILRFVNGEGKLLAEMAPSAGEYGWPRRNGFVQPLVDAELLRGLERYPGVTVAWSTRMQDFAETRDGVDVTLADADGETRRVHVPYVVGCDGGRSGTRRLMDVDFEGTTSATRWIVVDLENDPLGTPNSYVGADPARPYASISIAHGIRRFEFMLFAHETDEQVDTPHFVHRLLGRHIPRPEDAAIIRQRIYTHHSRIASSFHRGRIMIAGDAAHLMPVWQGQGYNSGIRDAANLGWKLAAVATGTAGQALLATYDEERRDHARAMIDLSTTVGKVISIRNRPLARLRDTLLTRASILPALKRYIVEMRFKPMPRYTSGAVVPAATENSPVGRLFIQPTVATPAGEVPLDEELGNWFAVLAWNNDPVTLLGKEAADSWRAFGARFIAVVPQAQLGYGGYGPDVRLVGDPGGIKSWFDRHRESVLFLRPDRFVAAACLAQEAPETSRRLLGALHIAATAPDAPADVPARIEGK
ncbi:bifunctional 3-(3-hydroxy-phenyl)propionate/3-hydroxycinnamic acid hydroxylase [Nocardia sp. NPDC019395]|uniref:bifunctional 3-(3-hydroxy-phenyl)propionate/3-hydroxycinnamic acid hydroxylase n=1 Tax=Nocardia sp. NPDC019395 TaxID=3154686 RepID=UPI0033D0455B